MIIVDFISTLCILISKKIYDFCLKKNISQSYATTIFIYDMIYYQIMFQKQQNKIIVSNRQLKYNYLLE
jgi:hypothetical protein